jgi:glycosyltransferase involved in cell wall biosynthesis
MSIKNNTKVSILIITDAWTPQVNGVVRTYQYINKELEARGYEVNVIGPHDFPIRLKTPGYSEIELALFTRKKLRNLIESFTPDIIHLATEGPLGRAGKKYCDKRSLAYTTCYHTQFPDYIAKRVARALPFMFSPVKKFAIKSVKKFHHKSKAVMVATKTLEQQLKVLIEKTSFSQKKKQTYSKA